MDLSNHVILPREDFIELQTAAWDHPQLPVKDRFVNTANTSLVFLAMAGAVTLGTLGWAKALEWREEKAFQREARRREMEKKNSPS